MAKSSGGFAALVPSASTRFYNGKSQAKISKELSDALDSLSESFGGETIGIQSGYRSPAYNKGVGGAKSSYHTKGQAVDIDMTGWSEAKRQQAIEHLTSLGVGGFITYSAHPNMLHIDMRQRPPDAPPHFMFDKTAALMPNAPAWFQQSAALAKPPGLARQLPETMQAPQTLAQVDARERVAQAFRDPMRALDVVPSRLSMPARPATPTPMMALNTISPPSRFPSVAAGQVTRSPLEAIPASFTAAPIGRVERAPLGPVGQFTQPARSLQHPVSVAPPSNFAAAPVGQVTKGPALAPAVDMQALAAQHNQYRPSKVTQMPTVATPPSVPVGTLPATPATPLAHPISVPTAPVAVPPAPVLAPLLAPPVEVKNYPVADVPQAPVAPRATAYDVYAGLADTALDNTGKNTVSRDAFGNTVVENQYGAKTAMTPGGYQSAYGGLPGVPSLPGIKGPNMGRFGQAVKGAIPGLAGSAVGGLLAGPMGALVGAALAKQIASPGGLLSKQNVFDTNWFGPITTNKAQRGLGFPEAPSGGYKGSASFSNRSGSDMRSISPAAARDISRGVGGLF